MAVCAGEAHSLPYFFLQLSGMLSVASTAGFFFSSSLFFFCHLFFSHFFLLFFSSLFLFFPLLSTPHRPSFFSLLPSISLLPSFSFSSGSAPVHLSCASRPPPGASNFPSVSATGLIPKLPTITTPSLQGQSPATAHAK
jgi:hypothetical protein